MKKRILIITMLVSLLSQQMMALNLGDVLDGNSVSTSFGNWKSPVTGSRYFYGGSYTFAFSHPGRYQLFVQGEMPGAKIGCNGFSLSGGFIALLGIDEIKVMLKNAGATLAWGLMMGLQYTMPALFNVFATLRKWAREIQTILENACNLGRLIAARNPAVKKMKKTISNSYIGKINDWMSNQMKGAEGLGNFIDTSYRAVINNCAGLQGDAYKKCLKKKGATVSDEANAVVHSGQDSALNQFAGSHVKNSNITSNTLSITKLSTFLNTGKIQNQTIFSNGEQLNTYKTDILLSRLFYGDKATLAKTLKNIMMLDANANNGITEKTYKIDSKKIKQFIKLKLQEQITFSKDTGTGMIIPPKLTSAESAAKAILYGIKDGTCVNDCHDGYVDITDNYVYALNFAKDDSTKENFQVIGNVLNRAPNNSNGSVLAVQWKGAFISSLQVIRSIVKQKSGYDPTNKTIGEQTVTVKNPNSTDIKVPLLLPNIHKYIETIVLLEKKAKKETPYTAQLKEILAKYNAYFFSTSFMDMITGKIVAAFGANGDAAGNPKVKEIREYLNFVIDTKKEIIKKIKEDQKNEISYKNLAEIFEKIDRNIRRENMKGY